ncbi:MAG: hypothetical protein J7578_13980 [Chitinophagaceae bacterium]|nr:hypothetical protein [Chitinophagaceae bacterium]
MNTIAYILYFLTTYFITVHTGLSFYRNGRIYILNLLEGNAALTDFINRILLIGYYLLNLGYVALTVNEWDEILNIRELITTLGFRVGMIMLILAYIHFVNMGVILYIGKKQHSTNQKL